MTAGMSSHYRKTRYPNVRWRGATLYYLFRDFDGRWREVKYGAGDAKDAARAQQAAQENADRVRAGLVDPREAAMLEQAHRPVDSVLDEFAEYMRAKKRRPSEHHIRWTRRYIRRCFDFCGWARLADIEATKASRWLADSFDTARSRNAALKCLRSLVGWACDTNRLPYNPIRPRVLPTWDEEADRQRLSRSLTQAEFQAILDVAPIERSTFYVVLAVTGLRWRELRRVTWQDLDLTAGMMAVPAGQTKNEKRADLPLTAAAVDALAKWQAESKRTAGPLFDREPRLQTWRRDLIRSGLVRPYCEVQTRKLVEPGYVDERGRRLDRKCLRMSFCTWLKEAGVDIRDAQRLMRHSDINLTARIYTDVRLSNLQAAVEKLAPATPPVTPQQQQSA